MTLMDFLVVILIVVWSVGGEKFCYVYMGERARTIVNEKVLMMFSGSVLVGIGGVLLWN